MASDNLKAERLKLKACGRETPELAVQRCAAGEVLAAVVVADHRGHAEEEHRRFQIRMSRRSRRLGRQEISMFGLGTI